MLTHLEPQAQKNGRKKISKTRGGTLVGGGGLHRGERTASGKDTARVFGRTIRVLPSACDSLQQMLVTSAATNFQEGFGVRSKANLSEGCMGSLTRAWACHAQRSPQTTSNPPSALSQQAQRLSFQLSASRRAVRRSQEPQKQRPLETTRSPDAIGRFAACPVRQRHSRIERQRMQSGSIEMVTSYNKTGSTELICTLMRATEPFKALCRATFSALTILGDLHGNCIFKRV